MINSGKSHTPKYSHLVSCHKAYYDRFMIKSTPELLYYHPDTASCEKTPQEGLNYGTDHASADVATQERFDDSYGQMIPAINARRSANATRPEDHLTANPGYDQFLLEIYARALWQVETQDLPQLLMENLKFNDSMRKLRGSSGTWDHLFIYPLTDGSAQLEVYLSPHNGITQMVYFSIKDRLAVIVPLDHLGTLYFLQYLLCDTNGYSLREFSRLAPPDTNALIQDFLKQFTYTPSALPAIDQTRADKLHFIPDLTAPLRPLNANCSNKKRSWLKGFGWAAQATGARPGKAALIASVVIFLAITSYLIYCFYPQTPQHQLLRTTLRAGFSEFYYASAPPRNGVERCLLDVGWERIQHCSTGNFNHKEHQLNWDLSADPKSYHERYRYIDEVKVQDGVITITGYPGSDYEGISLIFRPLRNSVNGVRWIIDPRSTCHEHQLC